MGLGLFDSFIKEDNSPKKTKHNKGERSFDGSDMEAQSASSGPANETLPVPVKPKSFNDVYSLLNQLKLGQAVAVDLSELKEATAIRVLDILSGATYALGGEWRTYGSEVLLFALKGTFGL